MSTQRINLYRPERYRNPGRREAVAGTAVVLLALVAAVAHGVLGRVETARLAARLEAARAAQAALEQELESVRALPVPQADARLVARRDALHRELEGRRRLVGMLDARDLPGGAGFAGVLEGLARRRLEGVWIERLTIGDGGRDLAVGGGAVAPRLLPRWLAGLREEPAFAGRLFDEFAIRRPQPRPAQVEFDLRTRPSEGGAG
ncbi:hypothetical protein [Inmirania thermothiophila]|uniref:Type IV pilus assembly protein PilN n=1 Tax=Inmirania thermothiophila TaxID=1750597 RepID=A0A3N1Y5X1_9GAMM|nr:hypothetical protein [Inmirania thermothiophila]ROR34209.1 hypothetical protein EDC57_0105 [Inmirania thermothiophila]